MNSLTLTGLQLELVSLSKSLRFLDLLSSLRPVTKLT